MDKVTNSIIINILITSLKSFFLPFIILISVHLTQKIVAQEVAIVDNSAAVQAGKKLFNANCAACHGAKLEGQANWQIRTADGYLPAPPHDETGHTWHHPDQMLFEFTKYGPQHLAGADYRSIMPAYGGKLSDKEIWQVLA